MRATATLAVGSTGKFTIRQFYIFYTRPTSHDFDLLLKVFQMLNSKTNQGNKIQLATTDFDKCHTWFSYIHHKLGCLIEPNKVDNVKFTIDVTQ